MSINTVRHVKFGQGLARLDVSQAAMKNCQTHLSILQSTFKTFQTFLEQFLPLSVHSINQSLYPPKKNQLWMTTRRDFFYCCLSNYLNTSHKKKETNDQTKAFHVIIFSLRSVEWRFSEFFKYRTSSRWVHIDVELEAHAWIAIKLSFSINGIFSFQRNPGRCANKLNMKNLNDQPIFTTLSLFESPLSLFH